MTRTTIANRIAQPMMIALLTGPAGLLSFYLAWLCYRRACYRQTLVLSVFAVLMLVVTCGILGFGFIVWDEMSEGLAATAQT